MQCPKCGKDVQRVTGKVVYPNHPALSDRRFLACLTCDMRAPCNRRGKPTASLADGPTRRLRQQAHAAFDPLWKSGKMTRSGAYAWLRKAMGITEQECHMAWMSKSQLLLVVTLCHSKQMRMGELR